MKFLFLICIFSFAIISCDRQKNTPIQNRIKSFDFSYNNFFTNCFSIKFTQSDTVFVRQHFAANDTLQINKNYYAILSSTDRTTLDGLISRTNYFQFDSLYYQPYEDGSDYQFWFENDRVQKLIHVHSDSVPAPLETLAIWILTTKEHLSLHKTERAINFTSAQKLVLPQQVNFKLPEVN